METGYGKWKMETVKDLMQMDARVKLLINDHLLKTTSVQRPPLCKDHIKIMSQRLQMTEISCYRDYLYVKTTFQQRLHLPIFKSSPSVPEQQYKLVSNEDLLVFHQVTASSADSFIYAHIILLK